jgi:sterol desaturase/sphingolipid hydroxylase (fatty acid hydroxylase superfamily)
MKIKNLLLLSAAFGDLIGMNRLSNRLSFHNARHAQYQANANYATLYSSIFDHLLPTIKKARYIKHMKND